MFKARFMIDEPGEVNATMKVTMTVKEWEDLRDQITLSWPSSQLHYAITDLLARARQIIWSEGTSPKERVE